MSARSGAIWCEYSGCKIEVATGQVVDSMYVFEIRLHDSVIKAPALSNNMYISSFHDVCVTHQVVGGAVQHFIIAK